MLNMKLDLCRNTQQWIYRSKGYYELDWIRLIREGLSEADCFVDVGAHVGVFALTVAQACPDKKVVAIEALPSNYDLLVHNLFLNGLQNVETISGAIGLDESARARFYVNPINDGGGSLIPFEKYQTGGISFDAKEYQTKYSDFNPSQEVPIHRLEHFLKQKSIVKIDVEGSEMEVLTSAESSFNKGLVEMVIVEAGEETTGKLLKWFDEKGFDCFGKKVSYGGRIFVCLKRTSLLHRKIRS